MKNRTYIIFILLFSIIFSNSRVAFSRPAAILRTPGTTPNGDNSLKLPLFSVGFSSEIVNLDLPSASSSIYLTTTTSNGFNFGLSYTSLSDPRSKNIISPEQEYDENGDPIIVEELQYDIPTEVGLHFQKRVYSAGNINIDLGINDILARKVDGTSKFQNPSMFALFSSKKEFDKYLIIFNYGFGSGKVANDNQTIDFSADEEFAMQPYLGISLFAPESKRLKNRINLLFEYDGTGINLGTKIPITDEYIFSFGVVHASSMGDFGIRSKVGNGDLEILEEAATLCFGFQMNIPTRSKNIAINNPYTSPSMIPDNLDPDQQILYTSDAVQQLSDSLNFTIDQTNQNYSDIADSIRFLTFSLENSEIENSSLLHKISILEDSLSQNHHQKALDIKNFNIATRYISKSLRYFYNKDFSKALIAIDKAIELNPNLAIAYARKGTIYYSLGQTQNASINWNIALKLDPEYDEVRDILEALKENRLQSAELE